VEVQRLLDACFIREVQYPTWLVKIVMVKKKKRKWRMCTDFTNLNKCCLKDDFPLSRIDKVVDSALGRETMVLLDCFLDYHQIWLCKEDEEKNEFYHTLRHLLLFEDARRPLPTQHFVEYEGHSQRSDSQKYLHIH
jgi:hypothetical protein